jgi:hypothetical protein
MYPMQSDPDDRGPNVLFRYACRCTYIISMRKPFEAKFLHAQEAVEDVKSTAQRIGTAAESQATLNIALTGVCVAALLVAVLLVHRAGAGR